MASNSPSKYYTFVHEVPDKFICVICTEILCNPRLTECCGHHFCQRCLHNWKEHGNNTCPNCRRQNFNHMLDQSVQREIRQLKIYCSHKGEGCQWVGELGDLQTHLNSQQGCGYVEVTCPNSTSWTSPREPHFVKRKDLEKHLRRLCPLRRYKCIYCGLEDTYVFINESHSFTCCDFPLKCPNQCGDAQIKRRDMTTHRNQCPLEPVQCPFQDVRCKFTLTREYAEKYRKSHSHHHLQQTYQILETKCNALNQEITSLKRRCCSLKQENDELKQVNRTLLTRCTQLEERFTMYEGKVLPLFTVCVVVLFLLFLFCCLL